jgi:SHS2 domain-containing protein
MAWEHFPHDADVGVRGRGSSLEEAFTDAAVALTAVVTDPAGVRPLSAVAISCEAPDADTLFYDWLNAIVFEMATRNMLFGRFDVTLDAGRLRARAWGESVEVSRHSPAVEVKGATWTALRVDRDPDGSFVAQCVVDV